MSGARFRRLLLALVAGALGLASGGAALALGTAPQTLMNPAGPQGLELYKAMIFDIKGIILLWVILAFLLLYVVVRFSDRSHGKELPPQVEGNRNLEIGWSLALIAGLVIFLVHPVKAEFVFENPPEDPNAVEVKVTGHQFWWEVEYPQYGIKTANEIVIPAGTVVLVKTTATDVIHSLGVPRLGGKNDSMPGRVTKIWWKADQPGVYQGQCMQLCGQSHARMYFRVVAKTRDEFDAWVKAMQNPVVKAEGAAAKGQDVFMQKCAACHTIGGTSAAGTVGPNLTNLGLRTSIGGGIRENTPESLTQWIRDPQSLKPGALMPGAEKPAANGYPATAVTQEEVDALVAFLEGLK